MNKINIALPKGRLLKKVYDLFKKIGYENKELLEDNRKLVFEDKGVRYLIVKPSDVGIYVEKEVAPTAGSHLLTDFVKIAIAIIMLKKERWVKKLTD